MADTVFRRIRGRIVPIKVSKEEQKAARVKASLGLAAATSGAYAAGRLGPSGGFASAPKRIRKRFGFKAGKAGGIAFLLGGAVAIDNITKAAGYDDPTDGIAPTVALGFAGKKLAKLGKIHQGKAAFKRALNYSKFLPKL